MVPEQQLGAYVDYLRDMGIYDLYRREQPKVLLPEDLRERLSAARARPDALAAATRTPPAGAAATPVRADAGPARAATSPARAATTPARAATTPARAAAARAEAQPIAVALRAVHTPDPGVSAPPADGTDLSFGGGNQVAAPRPPSLDSLGELPAAESAPADRAAALQHLREEIGQCTRCPLAYGGRRSIVFGDGDPNARLMFVGEGPGAEEDTSGVPFVGKAGQLLNNMIAAMGLKREEVYIANIVKCRPPANRVPEFVEATTCSQFLARQIDIVRPSVIVALGATAATYLLGVKQPLASLRGQWHSVRGAKVAVTYHPAFLLRDPRQKSEAWKDLQRVMAEMGLSPPKRPT